METELAKPRRTGAEDDCSATEIAVVELHQLEALLFVDDLGAVGSFGHDELFVGNPELFEVVHVLQVVLVVEALGAHPEHGLEGRGAFALGVDLGE